MRANKPEGLEKLVGNDQINCPLCKSPMGIVRVDTSRSVQRISYRCEICNTKHTVEKSLSE